MVSPIVFVTGIATPVAGICGVDVLAAPPIAHLRLNVSSSGTIIMLVQFAGSVAPPLSAKIPDVVVSVS